MKYFLLISASPELRCLKQNTQGVKYSIYKQRSFENIKKMLLTLARCNTKQLTLLHYNYV